MKKFICFFLFIFLLFQTSCKDNTPSRNIIVLVDFSNSRNGSNIEWYKKVIETAILKKLGYKDRIVIIPIDRRSELWSQEIYSADFSVYEFSNEYAGLKSQEIEEKNLSDTITKAINKFSSAFDSTRSQRTIMSDGSDIIGALRVATKYILSGKKNIIIVLSDMSQISDGKKMNFDRYLNDNSEINSILKYCAKVDLQKTESIILTGSLTSITSKKYSLLQTFWKQYLTQCDSELKDFSTSSLVALEKLLSKQ